MAFTGTNVASGSLTGGFTPGATQNGAIIAGNLSAGGGSGGPTAGLGGSVNIITGGAVTLNSVTTAGAGGFTVYELNASNGSNGGNITINAGANVLINNNLDAFGGGGGGGAGGFTTTGAFLPVNGSTGGAGGTGGAIFVRTTSGTITIGGEVNSSGGGGGGGGGGSGAQAGASSGGTGGAGGVAGPVTLDAPGNVTANGPIYAADGAAGSQGGNGGLSEAQSGGGGGGGGGSYGGGGGGGGGGAFLTSASGAGGGGGAGAFGGGGGYGVSFGGTGGGFALAPAGTPGANGGAGFGGNAVSINPSGGLGGTSIGAGGTGGSAFPDAAGGSNGASELTAGGTTGLVSITGANILTNNVVVADQITMSAQPGSNGSISFLGALTSTTMFSQSQGISLSSDGSGGISSSNNSPIATYALTLDLASGSAGTLTQPLIYSPFPGGSNGARHFIIPTDSNAFTGSIYISTSVRNVTVSAGQVGVFNLTASDPFAIVTVSGAFHSNNITIDASGANGLIEGSPEAANTASNNGGRIALTASAIENPGSPVPFVVSANSASGKGGVVSVDITATGTTTLGTGAGQLELSATGTAGGSISLTTPGTLSLVTNAAGVPAGINVAPSSGAGGSIILNASTLSWGLTGTGNGTPLVLNANSFNSGDGGAGGTVAITQTGNTAILLGAANSQISLQATGTSGGSVSFTTAGSLGIVTNGTGNPQGINVAPTSGAGGSITLNANALSWGTSGTNSSTSPLLLNADGFNIGSGGAGGTISLTQTSSGTSLVLGSGSTNGQISLQAIGTSGGSVSFSTAGSLGIVTNGTGAQQGINVAPTSNNGGSINLTANTFTWGAITGTGQSTDLLLNADGFSSGSAGLGGFIGLKQSSSATLNVGTGVGQISFSTKGGNNTSLATGSGVAISSGGNLVVAPSGITITPSSSNVGENVTLQNNSATAFNYGLNSATNKNGVLGSISVAGSSGNGNLSLINLGGALTNSAAITAVNILTMTAGGTGSLTVGANIGSTTSSSILLSTLGTGNVSATKAISAGTTLNLFSEGGSIGGASPLTFAAPAVNAGAPAGVINLNDTTPNTTGSAKLEVGAFGGQDDLSGTVLIPAQTAISAGGAVTLSTATSINTTANINASTNSTLISTNITLTSTGTAAGTGISLGGNINASTPMSTGGAVSITGAGPAGIMQASADDISGVKSVTLTAGKGNVAVGTLGQATETGTVNLTGINISTNEIKAIISITEKATGTTGVLGNINLVAGAIDATSASAGVVSLSAGPGGISAASGTDISGGKSVTLLAPTGSINIASIGSSPTGTVQLTALNSIVSSAKLSGSAVTLLETAALGAGIAVNNISATAALSLTAVSKIIATGSLAGSSVNLSQTSTSGSGITVNNIATTNGAISVIAAGNLNVDAGASITTSATTNKTSTITLEDNNTTNGNITINGGDQISTSAINGGNGNLNITIGPVPASPTIVDAPAGTGISYNPAQPGAAPFSYFINPTGVTFVSSASSPISFNYVGNGQLIVNNGSKGSGLITINGGTTSSSPTKITADPLVGSALAPALPAVQAKAAVSVSASADETQSNYSIIKLGDSSSSKASQSNVLSFLNSETVNEGTVNSASLNTLPLSGTSALSGSAQSSIIEETISASKISNPITRTLYGATTETEYQVPEENIFVGGGAKPVEIEAVMLAGVDMGISGPSRSSSVEMNEMNGSSSRVIKLRRGNVIVAPENDTLIETSFGNVEVGAKSVVFIMALSTGTAVFNLDDSHRNSVSVSVGKKQMALAPGRQAMITSQLVGEFEMVNPAEAFAYRNLTSTNLDAALKLFSSEFLLPNVIGNIKQLRVMLNSPHPQAKRMSQHLLKTAASIGQLNRQQDQFQQYLHPRLTAEAFVQ